MIDEIGGIGIGVGVNADYFKRGFACDKLQLIVDMTPLL